MSKTYTEKLRDPRWQMRRLEIMKKYQAACYYCYADDKELHVHHIVYVRGRDPWEYDDNELVCVCCECHGKIERAKRWISKVFGHSLSENWYPLAQAIEAIYIASPNIEEFQKNVDLWLKKAAPKKRKNTKG